MKAPKELLVLKTTTNTVEATATLARNAKGSRPMKSMVAVRSFRPKTATQVATAVTEVSKQLQAR